jgi:acetyl esterase/lipase
MPSKQSEAVRRRWEAARLAMTEPGAEAPDDESWGDLTAEPRGVDYLETEAGGLPAMWAVPKGSRPDRVLLCLHGGGFVGGSVYTHRKMFGHLAKAAGVRALLIGYRLLPQGGAYPVPVDEGEAAYRWLLGQGIAAEHIAFAGDSVGGWLAVTVQLRAREKGLPRPAAALLLSPFADLEASGQSYDTGQDPLFTRDFCRGLALGFLGEAAGLRDPRVNLLYAGLDGLSPLYIQAGGDEALLDDARGLGERARQAGLDVRLDIFPGMLHTFQMAAGRAPEADDAIARLAGWVRPRLGL